MMSTSIKIKDLTAGQTFRDLNTNHIYQVQRPYWPEARNPAYRAAFIVLVESYTHPIHGLIKAGQPTSFNCNTKVELVDLSK